jgi:hypothetical protein
MPQRRSAQGKMIDMTALAARNERVRAVGNMNVNARGDTIDAFGKVIVPATQKVGEQYQRTVGNRSANPIKSKKVAQPEPELTQEEIDLNNSFDDDLEVEKIKAKETKK